MAAASESPRTGGGYVRVLFDYDYTKKDGTHIKISRDQLYHLVEKTNDVWWRVRPTSKTQLAPEMKPGKAFYLPANYVEVADDHGTSSSVAGISTNGSRNSSRNGSLKSASSSTSQQPQPPPSSSIQAASTPPQRYENWIVKSAASRSSSYHAADASAAAAAAARIEAPSVSTLTSSSLAFSPAIMTTSTPSPASLRLDVDDDDHNAAQSSPTTNVDYSSKKSVAEKRQSFELMSSSTTSLGSTTSHAPSLSSQYPVVGIPQQQQHQPQNHHHNQSNLGSKSNAVIKAGITAPVAVPGGKNHAAPTHQPDDYDEVDDETRNSIINHHLKPDARPLPQIPDGGDHSSSTLGDPTSGVTNASTTSSTAKTNHQQKTHHQQSSSYDSGIDNPCYARLDELQQQMMATSIGALGGGGGGVIEVDASGGDRKLVIEADDDKTGSSNTLDTEDSQSIPDIDVLEIGGGAARSSFKSNSKPVNLSSFKNPLFQQQQQQQQPSQHEREASPLSSFGSLEKSGTSASQQRHNKLSDSSDDVFEGFVKKSSLLNSFTAASPGLLSKWPMKLLL